MVAITKKIKIVQKSRVFVRRTKKFKDLANQRVIKGSTTTHSKSVRKTDEDSSNPKSANCQGSFAKGAHSSGFEHDFRKGGGKCR